MNKINKPEDLRRILLSSIESVLEGKMSVSQANAVVGLSGELHKSIRQEWEMRCYAADNMHLENGEIIKMIKV
jgi:hypothetical protein